MQSPRREREYSAWVKVRTYPGPLPLTGCAACRETPAMRLLPRYVLIELLKVFAVTVTSLTTLMMLVGVAKEAIEQGLGLVQILQMLPYILPDASLSRSPVARCSPCQSSTVACRWRNEIVAIKSLGINPMTVLWPALILAFLLSLICVWLNDVSVSWGFNNMQRVAIEAIDDIAYGMLRTQKSFGTNGFTINVKRVDDRKLIKPVITFNASGTTPPYTITAQEGELRCDTEQQGADHRLRAGARAGRRPGQLPLQSRRARNLAARRRRQAGAQTSSSRTSP